ncbi:hypothetical protein E2320_018759, partial [Naja naja]
GTVVVKLLKSSIDRRLLFLIRSLYNQTSSQNTGAWTRHRIQVLNLASCSHQQILRFFYTQGGQFIPSALRIYKAKTLAQTLYGIPIWIRGFKDCIERTQAVFLRKLLGLLPCVGFALMHLELGIRSVKGMAWINIFKWWIQVFL